MSEVFVVLYEIVRLITAEESTAFLLPEVQFMLLAVGAEGGSLTPYN